MKIRAKEVTASGFTLVELIIAMAVSTLVMAAIYSAYITYSRVNSAQESVVEMQQNIRAALGPLIRDLRMAGFNPAGATNIGFVDGFTFSNGGGLNQLVNTDGIQVAFASDLDEDGSLDTTPQDSNGDGFTDMFDMEQVAYRLNGTNLQRYSTTTGAIQWQTIAEQIERIELNYVIDDTTSPPTTTTTPTAANLNDISSVEITLLARADRPDPKFTNAIPYTTASGAVWPPANDNFRRRLLIASVKCRNMGL